MPNRTLDTGYPALPERGWALRAGFCLLLVAICLNALGYAAKTANPVLVSDSWHFVHSVVMPYAQGDFDVGDLLAKRGATDHSQPLRKAMLLLNYEWFDLDFSVDAILGILAALVSLALFWAMGLRDKSPAPSVTVGKYVAFLALTASYLSLSSPIIYSWPLVTTSYTNHPFILLYAWAAWRVLVHRNLSRSAQLLAAGTFLCVIADDTGLLASVAIAIAALLHGVLTREFKAPLAVILINAASYASYSAMYAIVSGTPEAGGVPAVSAGAAFTSLFGNWHEAWNVVAAPLAGSIAHRGDLPGWSDQPLAIVFATGILLAAHVWFWWTSIRGRRNTPTFVAISLMLLFYGLFAGVFLARASEYGLEYFWQPRYSIFYRWNLIAIFLMLLGQLSNGTGVRGRALFESALRPVKVLAAALLLLQIPLSLSAWKGVPHIENYQRRQAEQILSLAGNPDTMPSRCISGIVVCRFRTEARRNVMWFLESQHLNVFNEEIRRRHELGPVPNHAMD